MKALRRVGLSARNCCERSRNAFQIIFATLSTVAHFLVEKSRYGIWIDGEERDEDITGLQFYTIEAMSAELTFLSTEVVHD